MIFVFVFEFESAVYHPFSLVLEVRLTFPKRTNKPKHIHCVHTLAVKWFLVHKEQTNKWYEWDVVYNNTYDARRAGLTCLVALRMFLFCGVVILAKNLNNVFGDKMCTLYLLFLWYIARRVNILWRFQALGNSFFVYVLGIQSCRRCVSLNII